MDIPVKLLTELCKKYKLQLMILFGSCAINMNKTNSDIDLAIYARDLDLIEEKKIVLLNKLAKIFHRDIDLILLNKANSLLKFNIAREGKLIYEKKEGMYKIFQVRAMSEHNDARKFYELDRQYINNYLVGRYNNGKQRVSPPQIK